MTNSELKHEDLEKIAGGWKKDADELRAFINKYDPNFAIRNDGDIIIWLVNSAGVNVRKASLNDEWYNEYRLGNGETISHSQLMELLN